MKRILPQSLLVLGFLLAPLLFFAQSKDKPKDHWQHLDLSSEGVFGISTEKAYQLLKNRTAVPVLVAVIDGGIDIEHEDLKEVIWTNTKEIPGNAKDDDGNGYVDDVHGWSFIGSEKGNVQFDNTELVRLLRKLKPKYESALNSTPFSPEERKEFEQYQRLITDYAAELEAAKGGFYSISLFKKTLQEILEKMGKSSPKLADFENYKATNDLESRALKAVKSSLKEDPDFEKLKKELDESFQQYDVRLKYHLNMEYDSRSMVGDDYTNSSERYYGSPDVKGPDAEHGTHVAGIIGAVRNNGKGLNGIADRVQIMPLRVVPDGDERDKDVANAIRYAVDNGAKIINMSFGKAHVWDKAVVDSALRYAQAKDVLLVHAAGNDAKNIDIAKNYPTRYYTDSTGLNVGMAAAWMEVGASGWEDDEHLVAEFSNYGKKNVDVFAPGVQIYSSIPGSAYKQINGTSMAAPVVSGLAAILRSYFPELSATAVKDLIIQSVQKVDQKVKLKAEQGASRLHFSEICVSAGVVNAAKAVEMAMKSSR
ncbi:MAG: hypothetical protein RI924_48 [Bacteroidota bacterium]|jgi:subtilisin family serine protease